MILPTDAAAAQPTSEANKLRQVTQWILEGASEHDIRDAAEVAWPGENAMPLIVQSLTEIAASSNYDKRVVVGFCVEGTRELYRRMIAIGDFSGALKALRQLYDIATRNTGHVRSSETDTDQTITAQPTARLGGQQPKRR